MKKLTTIVILILTFAPSFAQKSSFRLLDNPVYSPLANPDSIFTRDNLRRDHENWQVIDLGFSFPRVGNKQLRVHGNGFDIVQGELYFMLDMYPRFNTIQDTTGILTYGNDSKLKIKYQEFSGVKRTILQFENMRFDSFPQFRLNYQLVIYSTGKIQVYYGDHNFNETFPAYEDIYFSYGILESWSYLLGLVVSQDFQNPKLQDQHDPFDEENFKPFPRMPKNWCFEFDVTEVSTSINNVVKDETEPLELIGDQLHVHSCAHGVGELFLFQADGVLLEKHEIKKEKQILDLSKYHKQMLIVHFDCGEGLKHSSRFLIN